MLSRSSLTIRRLMPQRRYSEEDIDGIGTELNTGDPSTNTTSAWSENTIVTAGARRINHRKTATAPGPIIATNSLTHNDILRPLPPLPTETPRSSDSSDCRCERRGDCDCDCPLANWKRRTPLCSISSKEGTEASSLPSSFRSFGSDDSLGRRIPKSRFISKSHDDTSRSSSLDLELRDRNLIEKTTSQPIHPQKYSEDVLNFIHETDKAFKDDELLTTHISLLQSTKPEVSDTSPTLPSAPPTPPPKEPSTLPPKSPPRLSQDRPQDRTFPATHNITPPLNPPKDNFVLSNPPQKKQRKFRSMKTQRKPTAPKLAVKGPPRWADSRWTLTDNVSGLLTGKLFHKIDADEMLTPDQIEAFKQRRLMLRQAEAQAQQTEEAEAVDDDSAETPIEPFYLEDDLSRVESAAIDTPHAETTREARRSISFSEDVVTRDFSFERQHAASPIPIPSGSPPGPRSLTKNKTFPMVSPIQSGHRRQVSNDLPAIPEADSLYSTPQPQPGDELFFGHMSNDSQEELADSEYIFLECSPCTVTVPTFRHGSIRLSKPDLMPDPNLGADEGLDWTAFQMAILGGAGDWFSDSDDTVRRREQDEADEIAEWWDSWHFQSTGDLITRDFEASSPTSTISGEELPDIPYTQTENDNSYHAHHGWQQTPHGQGLGLNMDYAQDKPDAHSYYPAPLRVNEKWRRDSEQKQVVVNRDSLATLNSLPPSPMLDLRVMPSNHGDDLDVVPMGFNLGHDLGDYLKWETEHAFAGDFS
ncbi:hypothetical protein F5Y18DRAFT_204061 [Xylariaceae sp. FL1019]|nr:hypothetical protein F5Y18DRAFT_204061 [Xylariaceae sp. FL1019]